MTLRARLNRLSARRVIQGKRPTVTRIIFNAVQREGGEIVAKVASALVWTPSGWETISLEESETEADFIERVEQIDTAAASK